jgi:hypothetical protein
VKKDTNLPGKGSDESYDTKQSGGPFLIANRKMRSPLPEPLRFLVLAPSVGPCTPTRSSTRADKRLYRSVLQATQRFRGQVYVKDGAIQERQLDAEGRYCMHRDEESWHMLLVTPELQIAGCARYLVHPNTTTFEELALRHSPLAHCETWGSKVRHAFETEIRIARSEGLPYVELGGWALGEEWRGSMAALKILLASYAWAKLMGGWRCACTATVRHGSASILRRIGGGSLEYYGQELPVYEDPAYGCTMEFLRFDSRYPNPRFAPLVEKVEAELSDAVIITNSRVKSVVKANANHALLVA